MLASLSHGQARAQLIGRYFPANIPAYEDWFATVDTSGVGDQQVTGERVGSFIIQPTFTEGIGYDSDPSGRPSGAGSADLSSSGVVTVTSDWSRNALGAALTVNDVRYFSQPTFDYTTWTASAGGAIDYGDDEIRLGYIHVNSVTLPTDAGTFGLTAPITNQIDDFRVSDTIGPGPLTLVPAVVGDLYRFSAPPGELAGLEQGVSNRNVVTPSITANYQFAGGHNLVVVLSDEYGTYPGGNTGGFTPNYNDVSLLAGIEYRQSALFAYRALVGYEERFLQGNGHAGGTISAPAAELDAIWTPTALMSLTGQLSQSLQDEATASGQGLKETSAQLIYKYAIRRNVVLGSSVQYTRTSATPTQGAQDIISAGAEADWRLNRRLSLSLRYDFSKGEGGTSDVENFTRNQVLLRATFSL